MIRNFISELPDFNSHTREGVTEIEDIRSKSDGDFNSHTREGVTYFATVLH